MPDHGAGTAGCPDEDRDAPDALLWLALCMAPAEGAGIDELMRASGMSRPTLYRRLADHARAGRAVQVGRGRWRALSAQDPYQS